jgi:cell division protein FtsB
MPFDPDTFNPDDYSVWKGEIRSAKDAEYRHRCAQKKINVAQYVIDEEEEEALADGLKRVAELKAQIAKEEAEIEELHRCETDPMPDEIDISSWTWPPGPTVPQFRMLTRQVRAREEKRVAQIREERARREELEVNLEKLREENARLKETIAAESGEPVYSCHSPQC